MLLLLLVVRVLLDVVVMFDVLRYSKEILVLIKFSKDLPSLNLISTRISFEEFRFGLKFQKKKIQKCSYIKTPPKRENNFAKNYLLRTVDKDSYVSIFAIIMF